MNFSINQDNIIINIHANQRLANELYKFLKGFVNFGEASEKANFTISFLDDYDRAPTTSLPFSEHRNAIKSRYILNENVLYVWLNPQDIEWKSDFTAKMIVSNVYSKILHNNGYFFLHCSSASLDGKCVVFCGEKNTGKTVNLINLLNNGFSFVTNDMLAIKYIDNNLVCHGMPYDVGIRMTHPWMDLPDNLKYVLYAKSKNFNLNLNNASADENKLFISPSKISELNNTHIEGSCQLAEILNTTYSAQTEELMCTPLHPSSIKTLVFSQKLPPVHPSKSFLDEIIPKNREIAKLERFITFQKICELPSYKVDENQYTIGEIPHFIANVLGISDENF